MFTRRTFIAATIPVATARAVSLPERSFWVMKLLFPRSLLIKPLGTARLHCSDARRQWIAEGSDLLALNIQSPEINVTGPGGSPVSFLLCAEGLLERRYFGTLQVRTEGQMLQPIVRMDCETAVGSIVSAELPVSRAPLAAMCAQAVAARSVLLAPRAPRHGAADFCDTTHCQFLRSPAVAGSLAARSLAGTERQVLVDDGQILFARYSASCGGKTEAGVICEPCLRAGTPRNGHGCGLCQSGAIELAQSGFSYPQILAKYYPGAKLRCVTG